MTASPTDAGMPSEEEAHELFERAADQYDAWEAQGGRRTSRAYWKARALSAEAKLAQAVETNHKLQADLAMAAESEVVANCEQCGAPLFVGEDFVSDPDGVAGCWYAVTDIQSKRDRPCFAHRVGKPEARARSARGEKT